MTKVYLHDLPLYVAWVRYPSLYRNLEDLVKLIKIRDKEALRPFLNYYSSVNEDGFLAWLDNPIAEYFGVVRNLYHNYKKSPRLTPLNVNRYLKRFLWDRHPYVLKYGEVLNFDPDQGVYDHDLVDEFDDALNSSNSVVEEGDVVDSCEVVAAFRPFFYIVYNHDQSYLSMIPYFIGQHFSDVEKGKSLNVLSHNVVNPDRLSEGYKIFTFDLNKIAIEFYDWLVCQSDETGCEIQRVASMPFIPSNLFIPLQTITYGLSDGDDSVALYNLFPVYCLD